LPFSAVEHYSSSFPSLIHSSLDKQSLMNQTISLIAKGDEQTYMLKYYPISQSIPFKFPRKFAQKINFSSQEQVVYLSLN
jgi:hypothetical protein